MYPGKNPSGVWDRESRAGNSQRQGRFQNDINQPNFDIRSLMSSNSTELLRKSRGTGALENLNKVPWTQGLQFSPGFNLPMKPSLDDDEFLAIIQRNNNLLTNREDGRDRNMLSTMMQYNNQGKDFGFTFKNSNSEVKAENDFEEDSYSDHTNDESPPEPPSAVKGLKLVMVTFQLVLLEFDEPKSNGSDIVSYIFKIEVRNKSARSNNRKLKAYRAKSEIESSDDEKSDEEVAKKKNQRRETVTVDNMNLFCSKNGDEDEAGTVVKHIHYLMHELDHSTSYRISVQAVNNVGTGLASNFLEVTTYSLPPPPASVNCSKQDSWLKFVWEPVPSRIQVPWLPENLSWLKPPPVSYNVKIRYPYGVDFFNIYEGTDIGTWMELVNGYDTVDVKISSGFFNIFSPCNKIFRLNLADESSKDTSWGILTKRGIRITGMESMYGMLTNIKTENHEKNKIRMIKDVQQFCERELARFELQASNFILETGLLSRDMFTFDDKSKQYVNSIKADLQQGCHLGIYGIFWSKVIRLIELIEAIMEKNFTNIAKVYYKLQCRHTLFATDKPLEIPVFIMNDTTNTWKGHLRTAINSINEAAPGLYLYITDRKETAKVIVGNDQVNTRDVDTPATRPLNKEKGTVFIHLPINYPSVDRLRYSGMESDDLMVGSAIHEILHALDFSHHYQRFDADLYLSIDESLKEQQKNDFSKTCTIFNLVRHDLSSILHTNEQKGRCERIEGDPFSALKTNSKRSCELSEGDKVALNLKYKPCRSNRYNPKVNSKLGIIYCGRSVMRNHDQFSKGTTDTKCGPNNWANCPACRVIHDIVNEDGSLEELSTVNTCIDDGRWQGFTGLFYCGKTYNSPFVDNLNVKRDGVCGPDVGIPCTDCGKIMHPEYSIKMYRPKKQSPVQPKSTTPNRVEQNPKSVACTIA